MRGKRWATNEWSNPYDVAETVAGRWDGQYSAADLVFDKARSKIVGVVTEDHLITDLRGALNDPGVDIVAKAWPQGVERLEDGTPLLEGPEMDEDIPLDGDPTIMVDSSLLLSGILLQARRATYGSGHDRAVTGDVGPRGADRVRSGELGAS